MTASFHYEIVGSALHDPQSLAEVTAAVAGRLRELEGVGSPASKSADLPFVTVVGTGGTESQIIDRWRVRQSMNINEPALLVAHHGQNSLAASLEALAYIRQQGGHGRIVMSDRLAELARAVQDQTAYLILRKARLGQIGIPSSWLIASSPPAEVVQRRWGPTLVPLPTTALALAGTAAPSEVSVALGRRWSRFDESGSIAVSEMQRAAAIHQPLVDLIDEHGLDAVTVRCFDLLESAHTSGCLALAELNGQGIVAGCEGDLPSAIAMMWVHAMFGTASWMANPATIDPELGEIVLAHCTVAPSLVEDAELTTHFESGIGVGISGRFRHQDVCLVRIGGADLEQIWITDGELVTSGHDPDLCRTQATVLVPPSAATELLERPLGNHVVLVPGHHANRMKRWWDLYVGDAAAGAMTATGLLLTP